GARTAAGSRPAAHWTEHATSRHRVQARRPDPPHTRLERARRGSVRRCVSARSCRAGTDLVLTRSLSMPRCAVRAPIAAGARMFQTSERYRVRREIGRGRCAVVLEADDLLLGRQVALKCGLDPGHDELLLTEARRLARIDSRYVVPLFDVVAAPRPMLVRELLRGETLRARLARAGRLTLAEVDEITTALLRGLEALHAHGVVHGDLKPENVWILPDRALKLLDVGAGNDATALY